MKLIQRLLLSLALIQRVCSCFQTHQNAIWNGLMLASEGASRFLRRIFQMTKDPELAPIGSELLPDSQGSALALIRISHKSILRMSADIENFRFNRAGPAHILANTISDVKMSDRGAVTNDLAGNFSTAFCFNITAYC